MYVKVWLILVFFVTVSAVPDGKTRLRVMTLNTWNSGAEFDQGLNKLAKHFQQVDADVIAVQEGKMNEILSKLGPNYRGHAIDAADPNVGIITKHDMDLSTLIHTPGTVGFKISFLNSTKSIYFYSLRLTRFVYGPYNAKNGYNKHQLDREEGTRVSQVQRLISTPGFQAQVQSAVSGGIPLIVAGSFESPSHLDWIESTKHLHFGVVHEWPVTKLLSVNAKLTDSFRAVYPDPLTVPGNTWSTLKTSFPDRIDYILFNSPKLTPVDSFIYSGCSPLKEKPNHRNNDFPTMHYAVVSDFLLD